MGSVSETGGQPDHQIAGIRLGYAKHFREPSKSKFYSHVWVRIKLKSLFHCIMSLYSGYLVVR